jgi:hypothetical protein
MPTKAAIRRRPRPSYPLSGVLRHATLPQGTAREAVADTSDLTFMIEEFDDRSLPLRDRRTGAPDQKGDFTWQYPPQTGAA